AAHAEDAATAVRYAVAHGLRVAAQGTGHNAAPLGELGDTLLLRTDLMRGVTIDPERMIARVEAGTLWQQVTEAAAEHGLAALAGSSADVGVVGYTLGGGVSWLARSHGLGANSVTAIELVTADGEFRRVDERADPDLFWALRGGGGAFGVVTALEFRLYAMTSVYAGALFWPIDRAADVMHAWRDWTVDLPASVMTAARVMTFPPFLDVPAPLRGRAFVIVEAVLQDAAAAADALLAELRRLQPEIDTFAVTPLPALSALHMDPPGPVPGIGDGALIRELDERAVDAFLSVAATPRGGSILSAELRLLGAALAPGTPGTPGQEDGGAVSGLNGSHLMFAGGMGDTPENAATVRGELDDLLGVLAPWRSESDYLNFAETPARAERLYGDALPRLREIKQRVDPDDVIRSNHPLGRIHGATAPAQVGAGAVSPK
ncbi:FAD-binding protein, partial [Microbacterium sp.]|uniref:FAD-dependent oxidoreductase n=1 Tax=Microbacterium sp. TaxID=51671 RepID=UPI003C78E51B